MCVCDGVCGGEGGVITMYIHVHVRQNKDVFCCLKCRDRCTLQPLKSGHIHNVGHLLLSQGHLYA